MQCQPVTQLSGNDWIDENDDKELKSQNYILFQLSDKMNERYNKRTIS